jgi:hypothetical protein
MWLIIAIIEIKIKLAVLNFKIQKKLSFKLIYITPGIL